MAKFGDYVAYDGLIYRIVAVSEDAEPTYTLEPMRKSEAELKKTVDVSQSQLFLVPSDDGRVEGVAGSAITVVGSRTALANALADGYVRVKFDVDGGSLVDAQIIVEGAKATKPNDPTKEHYTFDDWYHNEARTVAVDFAVDEFEDSATRTKWIIDTFTVTYESNGGSTAMRPGLWITAILPLNPSPRLWMVIPLQDGTPMMHSKRLMTLPLL